MTGRRAAFGIFFLLTAGLGLAAGFALGRSAIPVQSGDLGRFVSTSGTEIELLLSESNLGGSETPDRRDHLPAGGQLGGPPPRSH